MSKIRIGIVGYGNVGRGAAKAVKAASDMELKAVFTRREPVSLSINDNNIAVLPVSSAEKKVDDIDVMILCGGSAVDLPEQGPYFASMFNIVDSYDTHAKIPDYMKSIDAAINTADKKTTAIISAGWDPGPLSMIRALSEAILPDGITNTFWGKGVSQGHSDAIRQISGVSHAVQYTIPIETAVETVRSGNAPVLEPIHKMLRECFVVVEPGTDKAEIDAKIKNMPHYFKDYDTTVHFIDAGEFFSKHTKMPHGGMVFRSGNTGDNKHVMEFSLKLDSNPEFTGSIMTAYARAAFRMPREGFFGAKTVFDVPLSYLSDKDRLTLIKELL